MRPTAAWVKDNVVISGQADASRYIIQANRIAHLPGDDVVSAGGVATDADTTQDAAIFVIEGKTAPKDIDTTDARANHRVIFLTIGCGIASVSHGGIDRIALLQTKESTAR